MTRTRRARSAARPPAAAAALLLAALTLTACGDDPSAASTPAMSVDDVLASAGVELPPSATNVELIDIRAETREDERPKYRFAYCVSFDVDPSDARALMVDRFDMTPGMFEHISDANLDLIGDRVGLEHTQPAGTVAMSEYVPEFDGTVDVVAVGPYLTEVRVGVSRYRYTSKTFPEWISTQPPAPSPSP